MYFHQNNKVYNLSYIIISYYLVNLINTDYSTDVISRKKLMNFV